MKNDSERVHRRKLELAFQELGKLSREELPAETWKELCRDWEGLKLGSLEEKLANLFAAEVRKPEMSDLAANTFLIACQYIQCCLYEARTVALVHCCHAKIVETAKEDMGDTIPLNNLIQVLMVPSVKNAKSRLSRLKKRRPDLIPEYLGPAEEALSYWFR